MVRDGFLPVEHSTIKDGKICVQEFMAISTNGEFHVHETCGKQSAMTSVQKHCNGIH